MIQPKKVVIGGTRVIINIENLEPIIVKDLKRNRSPKTKPTRPESASHIQLSALASVGRIIPLLSRLKTLRKTKPITNLMIFTESDPTFLLADSNEIDVIVQKKAVAKAANSPRCVLKKLMPLLFCGLKNIFS
jgi:hypothetical protein